MEIRDEGICRFCLKTFSGRSIGKHLLSCKAKGEKDKEDITDEKKREVVYYIKISGYSPYWLHIEAKSTARLSDLDKFFKKNLA